MILSELVIRQIKKFLLGDRPPFGRLRLVLLVVIPLLVVGLDIFLTIFGYFSDLFRQIVLIYFLGLISAFTASVAYVKDIYNQETDRIPFRHFSACFLGILMPKVKITNRMQDSEWKEIVQKIGGPAFLNISSGYAVLTETLTAPAHIYGQGGNHFISRHERVYEIVDLHEQEGSVPEVKATTKDGIEITVENLKFTYRLWDNQWERSEKNQEETRRPFPFSNNAIYSYAYNRFVQIDQYKKEKPFSWHSVVRGRIEGIIKDYINEHRLDDVIASREHEKKNPREEIRDQAYQAGFKNGLRAIGTILRWWDPGEFKSLDDIEGQFLFNWSVDLASNAELNRAYGEAQKQAYEELGRAEAEAELLMSIIHALDGIKFAADKTQTLQNLILMRTAQVIKALNTPTQAAKSSTEDKQEQDKNDMGTK